MSANQKWLITITKFKGALESLHRTAFVRLLSEFKPYWKSLFFALIFIALAEGIRLYLVWLTQDLLKPMIYEGFKEQRCDPIIESLKRALSSLVSSPRYAQLASICIAVIVFAFLRALFTFAHTFMTNRVCQKVVVNLRHKLYSHMQRLSPAFYEAHGTGRLLSHLTNDLNVLQVISAIGIQDIITTPLQMLGAFLLMLRLSWQLTLIVMFIVPITAWLIYITGRRIKVVTGRIQAALAEMMRTLTEALSSMQLVQVFNAEREALERFREKNMTVYREMLRSLRLKSALTPLVEFIALCGVAVGLLIGGYEVVSGRITPESLVPFMIYFHLLASGFRNLSRINIVREEVSAASERVYSVLDIPPQVMDAPDSIELEDVSGHIKFEGVTFVYPNGKVVLGNVSFEIKPGESVALVGPSGAGKTTIARLLLRLYEPVSGRILIDGHDIRQIKLSSLRRFIGFVPQEVLLLDGTVFENIAFGEPNATEEDVLQAAKLANAHEFICSLPEGYKTVIGERGARLSMGQRQRIAIARAIIRDPKILILDEATSNLDSESEAEVQRALESIRNGRTMLIIAHRLTSIRGVDRILVLVNGAIVEEGSHEELIEKGGLYQKLHQLQVVGINRGDASAQVG
ncbi:MAG: ABC transporter ATP-binding protein [Armatimonadota bacterium]|nr:ABC transporter ATP-binding protein/permease [Armatimonadota bacterium]MDW8025528.1 ABC transporter ATP-binding protein [Armatimonadota bacterium]